MAQHDYIIANQTFPNTRTDLNNVFAAIVSQNSGATAPSTTYAYQLWYDTTTDILKMRNANDDAWIDLFTIDQVADTASAAGAAAQGSNLIINGAMTVAQRSTSVASLGTANGYNTVDRWQMFVGSASAGRFTQSQASVTDLAGFPKSLKHEVTTADTSIAAGEALQIAQLIEGQNLQALKKGYSDAEQFTVSFYVKGTANTYVVEMYDADNTRHVAKTFSVTSSWSRVELTFPADTTGKFDNDNAVSLYLIIWLHAGSDFTSGTLPTTWASITSANRAVGAGSLYSAVSNTFEITGVQLEVGSATPFQHEDYGTTLAKCQRYYYESGGTATNDWGQKGYQLASNYVANTLSHPVAMRASPTVTKAGTFVTSAIAQPTPLGSSTTSWQWQAQKNGSSGAWTMYSNSSGKFTLQSEL